MKTSTIISQFSDSIQAKVNDLFSNSIVTPGKVIGSVLLSRDELLGMEELPVGSGPDLIDDSGLEVYEDRPGHMFSRSRLTEECIEGIVSASNGFV